MKLIDLLNKIAKGEEMPKKIAFDIYIYIWFNDFMGYCRFDEKKQKYIRMSTDFELTDALNEYAQIIEEKKLPEKINVKGSYNSNKGFEEFNDNEKILVDKINDLLDYLESNEKGE